MTSTVFVLVVRLLYVQDGLCFRSNAKGIWLLVLLLWNFFKVLER